MVHQHFMLIPVMTVAENIVLAAEPTDAGVLLDYARPSERVRELSERFGLAVDPRARIEDITVGQQQRVEILKALYRGADILVLDEPTAVLTPQEARELFEIIRGLTAQGKSIIFISHKLNEVLEIADRITVLRRGKLVETLPRRGRHRGGPRPADGRARGAAARREDRRRTPAEPLLEVEGLSVVDDRGLEKVRGVSFEVRAGEIVGIAGIDGNGQTELIDAIDRACAASTRGTVTRRRPGRHRRERASTGTSTPGSATSRRTASGAGSCSSSRSPRTSRSTTTAARRTRGSAGSSRAA